MEEAILAQRIKRYAGSINRLDLPQRAHIDGGVCTRCRLRSILGLEKAFPRLGCSSFIKSGARELAFERRETSSVSIYCWAVEYLSGPGPFST